MSTLKTVQKEIEDLLVALAKAALASDDDRAEALALARLYLEHTRLFLDSLRRNPWNYAFMIATGKRIEPFEPLRATTLAFIAKWQNR